MLILLLDMICVETCGQVKNSFYGPLKDVELRNLGVLIKKKLARAPVAVLQQQLRDKENGPKKERERKLE